SPRDLPFRRDPVPALPALWGTGGGQGLPGPLRGAACPRAVADPCPAHRLLPRLPPGTRGPSAGRLVVRRPHTRYFGLTRARLLPSAHSHPGGEHSSYSGKQSEG